MEYSDPTAWHNIIGQEFDLLYRVMGTPHLYRLFMGTNLINNTDGVLEVYLEELFNSLKNKKNGQYFRLTPLNFSPEMVPDFSMIFSFKTLTNKTAEMPFKRARIGLSTRNNSRCGDGKEYDGNVKMEFANRGELTWITVSPKKYIFNPEKELCRDSPYLTMICY